MKKGDVFVEPDGTRIEVRRVQAESEWADIKVIQPHGAFWTKRQPLVDGRFVFAAERCYHESCDGVDQTELHDPAKLWRCNSCGLVSTFPESRAASVGGAE